MLDATVGTETANSYATLEEADAYFAERANASGWESSVQKEALLITASRLIDWQLKFKGTKTTQTQTMEFPRTGIVYSSGYVLPETMIPTELKFSVFELAFASLENDRMADNPLAGIDQVKAGPLFIRATPGGVNSTKAGVIPDHIRLLLSNLISSPQIGVYRLIRA